MPHGPIDSPFAASGPLIEGKAGDQQSGSCRAKPADDKAHSDGARRSACCAALPSPRKHTSSCRVASWEPPREVGDAHRHTKPSIACFYFYRTDTVTLQRTRHASPQARACATAIPKLAQLLRPRLTHRLTQQGARQRVLALAVAVVHEYREVLPPCRVAREKFHCYMPKTTTWQEAKPPTVKFDKWLFCPSLNIQTRTRNSRKKLSFVRLLMPHPHFKAKPLC